MGMAHRHPPVGILRSLYIIALATLFLSCDRSKKSSRPYPLVPESFASLPPIAIDRPQIDTLIDLLTPVKDSTSLVWLQPSWKKLVHLFWKNDTLFYSSYYLDRETSLFRIDSGYTFRMRNLDHVGDTIKLMDLRGSLDVPVYVITNGAWINVARHREYDVNTEEGYWRKSYERIERAPSLDWVNAQKIKYRERCRQNDTNTLIRYFGSNCHSIYHQDGKWYMAEYSEIALTGIDELIKSAHPDGVRFDLTKPSVDEIKGWYSVFRRRDAVDMGRDPDEDLKEYIRYYVIEKSNKVRVHNMASDKPEYTSSGYTTRTWPYHHSYFDSVFYFGGDYVKKVFAY